MALTHNIKIGSLGETVACHYLLQTGYKLLDTNVRNKIGELDIIASKDKTTVFVEVKTRSGTQYGLGREAVNTRKQVKLIKAAQYYLQNKNLMSQPWQIDVIEIKTDVRGEVNEISHLENVVQASL